MQKKAAAGASMQQAVAAKHQQRASASNGRVNWPASLADVDSIACCKTLANRKRMRPPARVRARAHAVVCGLLRRHGPRPSAPRSQKSHGAAMPGSAHHASPGQPSPASHGDASPAAARHHFSKKPDLSPSISGPVRLKGSPSEARRQPQQCLKTEK